jgi:hypothetical protein
MKFIIEHLSKSFEKKEVLKENVRISDIPMGL